jgi:hypothetical protein
MGSDSWCNEFWRMKWKQKLPVLRIVTFLKTTFYSATDPGHFHTIILLTFTAKAKWKEYFLTFSIIKFHLETQSIQNIVMPDNL